MFNLLPMIIRFLALLPALTLHEFCHAYFASRAGDPTPHAAGRVTLNPLAHLDPIGTIMILFAPIGWAKPVPVNPLNFRRPTRDNIIVSAAGPASNFAQMVFWALVLRIISMAAPEAIVTSSYRATPLAGFLAFMVLINFNLGLFNLIPLGPLDGHHIMESILPYRLAKSYHGLNRYGMLILLAIIIGDRLLAHVIHISVLSIVIVLPGAKLGGLISGLPLLDVLGSSGIIPHG